VQVLWPVLQRCFIEGIQPTYLHNGQHLDPVSCRRKRLPIWRVSIAGFCGRQATEDRCPCQRKPQESPGREHMINSNRLARRPYVWHDRSGEDFDA